jgi:hypothetical protein
VPVAPTPEKTQRKQAHHCSLHFVTSVFGVATR